MDGMVPTCPDGSDEDPRYHVNRTCPLEGWFRCNNNQCIHFKHVCDGRTNDEFWEYGCSDGSDEGPMCEKWDNHPDYWKCADNLQCIKAEYVCDGKTFVNGTEFGCQDRSDEHNMLCKYCKEDDWPCKDGDGCVAISSVCDGILDCSDESDESVCDVWECPPSYWKCNNIQCIRNESVCDGKTVAKGREYGCQDGSDEFNTLCGCGADEWPCKDGKLCVEISSVCDGAIACEDGSDESVCKTWECPPEYWQCSNKQCIHNDHVCDGKIAADGVGYGCQDGSDESNQLCGVFVNETAYDGKWDHKRIWHNCMNC